MSNKRHELGLFKPERSKLAMLMPLLGMLLPGMLTAQTYPNPIQAPWTQQNYYGSEPSAAPLTTCESGTNQYYACIIVAAYDASRYTEWNGPATGIANDPIFLAINNVYDEEFTTTAGSSNTGLITVVAPCCTNSYTFLGAQADNNNTGHGSCTIQSGQYTYRGGTPSTPFDVGPNRYANYTLGIPYNCSD